jgi:hypothetical protein
MAGGLLQLVATGSKDAALTLNPEITFFKILYKKHTNFAIQQTIKNLGEKNFNTFNTYKLEKNGDLLLSMHYKINIPKFEIIKENINTNNTSYYDINSLEIFYNKDDAYVFYLDNNFYIIPKYILNLYNFTKNNIQSSVKLIVENLIPELIYSTNIAKQAIIIDINEDKTNPIISLLKKIGNFWENNLLTYLNNSNDYEYYNQLITLKSYVNHLSLKLDNNFYWNYYIYNNFRTNKEYYKLYEIKQYMLYLNSSDINFIVKDNYDVDVVYDYCIKNELSNYLLYQKNNLFINSLFIYNLLLQLYPLQFNKFTFWKKYILLSNNKPNIDFNVNTYNKFGEWSNNLNNTINTEIKNNITILYEIYKRNYSIAENNINQLFNLLTINNPSQLFIILSTFINQYDTTLSKINFSDYNSLLSNNYLDQKINEQLNKYNTLNIVNSEINAVPNITKSLTIYPVDLNILYGFLAYRLIDILANSVTFSNNLFLIYWRNKINNYCFMNYHQYNLSNINNSELYDSYDLNRKLTFYINLSLRNLLKLEDIKKYFIELFYSSSFFCCCDLNESEFLGLKNTINTINITQLQVNNASISLNENSINNYNDVQIINTYNILNSFIKENYTIKILDWNNNSKLSSIYYIIINEIKYFANKFININFELTLIFDYLPNNITKFILKEVHYIKLPLVSITNGTIPLNNIQLINIYKKINNILTLDNIVSDTLFTLNNLVIKLTNTINDYIYYFKLISININGNISRFLIDILNVDGNYMIVSNELKVFNKKEILSIDLEFINLTYRDIATKDANTIINNRFIINNRNDWIYDSTKTYWLYYDNKYITLRYDKDHFIVNDELENVVYIVREIDNASIPSFNNLINVHTNTNNISDLMDFFFQTPMIYLAKTLNSMPYIYFYNIPFLLNNSEIYLNNKKITIILPLNSNQFFGKSLTTLYDKENLLKQITHIELVKYVSSQFNLIYYQSEYINIINTIEEAKNIIINLNSNILLDNTYYGKTTQTIIDNIKKINSVDIINFNNDDFSLCNKLALELYGNNSTLISNSVIQGLVVNIYNYPIISNVPNKKITTDLINYLNTIPVEFNNQLNYINQNNDFLLLTNKNSYNEKYVSLSDIKTTIKNTAYDNGNIYKIEFLYPIENSGYNSLYYNNQRIDINNNILINNSIYVNNFNNIINNDDEYETNYININQNEFNYNKFNYLGPIYLDKNNINFTNIIDLSNYTHIMLDDNNMYLLSDFININNIYVNSMLKNSYLYKFKQIPYNYNIFNSLNKLVYYYKIKINLNGININDYGNCLFINDKFYYFEIFDYFLNIIEILSINPLNLLDKNYFIGITNINNINDILYPTFINISSITNIKFININLIENYVFNYFNSDNLVYNNLLFKNKIISTIKKINTYNFIYLDSSENNIKLIENIIENKKLPHIYIKNKSIISENINEKLFRIHGGNNIVKLDNYILNINDLSNNYIENGNYELSILPLENPNLITFSISGNVTKGNNQIVINFNSIINIPLPAYYNINGKYIYLSKLTNQIIINDKNTNYYNVGFFNNIKLLDNNYFKLEYPLFLNYENITLNENLIGNIKYVNQNIPVNNIKNISYVINSILNDNIYHNIYNYDISNINIYAEDEKVLELIFYDSLNLTYLLRPVVIKFKNPLINYPTFNISWYNNQIFNNSFIILRQIPQPTITFCTLTITFNETINSIESLQPCISIFSNATLTVNSISFNDINGLMYNKIYKWKLLVNGLFIIYIWTYFSTTNFIYTTNIISEPIYLDNININLFSLNNNIQLINPNEIIILDNNLLKLNLQYYYNNINRKLIMKYYNDSFITTNKFYSILPSNSLKFNKYIPTLILLNNIEIKRFTNSFIYLDEISIEKLLEAKYLLIHNNNFYYTKIVNNTNEGIFIDTTYFNLDIVYKLNIYYSYSNIIYTNNKIVISTINDEYKIVSYEYNNFSSSEIISINNIFFQIIGLNSFTNYYDIKLISNNEPFKLLLNNFNGYYSMGVPNDKQLFNFPIIIYKEPILYKLDTYFLKIGDYYINNNILGPKMNNTLEYDIFSYDKNGLTITIFVKDNKFYNTNELTKINQNDILVYNNIIYHIKSISNFQLYFNESIYLSDGFYNFYYPFQPFNNAYITINNNGEIINSSLKLEPYYFIDIDNIFYSINNIPSIYFNTKKYVRIASFQDNKFYFENALYLNKYVNNIKLDNIYVLYVKGTIIDAYNVDLNDRKILSIYFYYNQPVKIGSSINFIKSLIYRDTTIILTLKYPLKIITSNVDVYLSPLALHQSKYLSAYEIDNFRAPSIDISNNIIEYVLDEKLLAINTKVNIPTLSSYTKLFFVDNYLQIDINKNKILSNLEIGSFHLLLEITPENNLFVHLCKIIYPHNLYFYTTTINIKSTFLLDKIYTIVINFIDNSFSFITTNIYIKNKLLSKIEPIIIWYKYPIIIKGIPIYNNNKFELEIINGNIFLDKEIFLTENAKTYNIIIIKNSKYYLISDTYLGNNISFVYLKNINYIKSSNPIIETFKPFLTNHDDNRLLTLIDPKNTKTEKIVNKTIIDLDTIGDKYKYKIYDLNNNQYYLQNNTDYNIGDPFLTVDDNYRYNSNTYIFTNYSVYNLNNITQLYNTIITTTEFFDHLKMFNSVPNIISKIKINNKIESYMILNTIKEWKLWTILSSLNLYPLPMLLNKGNIIYTNNKIYQDTSSNIYFTNNELDYLSDLLKFINSSTLEYQKIIIQNSLLNNILYELNYWINDSTFWLNVKDTINYYIVNLNINAYFNGDCLVFNDENIDSTVYFIKTDNITKRKYVLNNQYILVGQNIISRDMTKINDEVNLLILNENTYGIELNGIESNENTYGIKSNGIESNENTYGIESNGIKSNENTYGIELNNLLSTLYIIGEQYKIILSDLHIIKDVPTNYLNSIKLLINHIYNNYKLKLTELNKNFNDLLKINNKINKTTKKLLNYFTNDFNFIISNNYDISSEVFIKDYYLTENYNIDQNIIDNYTIDSNAIYSYYASLTKNIIIPEVIYELKFYNSSYDSYLFNLDKYPIELNFYLENDLSNDVNYSIVGLTNYNTISNYKGKLYTIINNYNINLELIDNIIYKNTNVMLYSYDISSYNIASLIDIEYNNFLELYKNVGVKSQSENNIYFYQNNFNYIIDKTYINFNNIYYPLFLDISGNYFITSNLLLTNTITLVILLDLINFIDNNKYIYKLTLDKYFVNYNDYINSSNNIIPINFKLNNTYIPNQVIFYSENEIIVKVQDEIVINYLSHYANIGENPPVQVNSIIKEQEYLYKTQEISSLLSSNSKIWVTDNSNYLMGIIANTNYLDLTNTIQFTLNILYDNINLINKKLYITTEWLINDYIYDPNNNKLIFIYPLSLNFSNNEYYEYLLNQILINNNEIIINKNQIILLNQTSISGSFYFVQKYKSTQPIVKPLLNQKAEITLINKLQNIYNIFLIPFDNYGNNIGSLMYRLLLKSNIPDNKLNQLDLIVHNLSYTVNIFYWNSLNDIIITTNEILPLNFGIYKVDVGDIIIDVISLNYYQKSYQECFFYYQNNINNFYVFINEECNNFNFTTQINNFRYYSHSKKVPIDLVNIYNPRIFKKSNKMNKTNIIQNTKNYIKEKPIINVKKIFKYISLYIGDQLIETLDENIYDIIFNLYSTEENKKKITKVIKIVENIDGYEIYIPLLFWFYNNSTISLPNVALPYVDINIKYQINEINDILLNDLNGVKLSSNPILHIELVSDTILLDIPERLLFGMYSHEYIIERFVTYPKNIIYKNKQSINIKFAGLIKDIIWISKPIYHPNDTCYKKNIYKYDEKYKYYVNADNEYKKYKVTTILTDSNINYNNDFIILKNIETEIILNNSSRITFINNDKLLNNYELKYVLFLIDKHCKTYSFENQIKNIRLYFIYIYKNIINTLDISPIKTINIQSNGVDLVSTMDNNYYNTLIPYQKFYNSPPIGYYIHSFSLYPLDKQPSGHLNFNNLENITLNIETSITENDNEPFNLVAVVKEYQILRVMSGQASLAWIN